MILTPLLTVVFVSLASLVKAQEDIDFEDGIHNVTSIVGTWTSQSRAVITGPDFVDPSKLEFKYPRNTGVSYSFSQDGFYEIARYRFNGNGSEPTCITGVIAWVHGKYTLHSNGSIEMVPFPDGFQQIQDPCAPVSNFIETYNFTELYTMWRIFQDVTDGPKLHLFQFDGAPVAPQYLVSPTPTMHPTRALRNDTWIRVDSKEKRSLLEDNVLQKRSSAIPASSINGFMAGTGMALLAFSSLLL
ncbi:ROT1 protein [Coprinopsis sp. MPI-PUGE-AT-0042]|nr:ROT1 protein [Coprinopsis sp. MPI-PUGE-AT-0042]